MHNQVASGTAAVAPAAPPGKAAVAPAAPEVAAASEYKVLNPKSETLIKVSIYQY
jgi:hypothetical protein